MKTQLALNDEEPTSLTDAMEEAKLALLGSGESAGDVMEAHGFNFEETREVIQPLIPALLQQYGPMDGLVVGIFLGLLAGLRMDLPTLDLPNTFDPDEPAGMMEE